MKNKALKKDFYIEIRKSRGRFLSIFFIVALGVSFFSGIRASEPDMRFSGDAYFDAHRLADMKVISTFGLTEKDIRAIGEVDGVEHAEYGYSIDALCAGNDSQKVLHIMSALPEMNQPDVLKGRIPEKENECFMDIDFLEASGYQVGDEIRLKSGTETPLKDNMKYDTYTIVGAGSSPCYISFERGSSMIGTGEVSGFLIVPESTFLMDVYTECYLSVEGAEKETAYTDGYQSKVDRVADHVEAIADARCELRREEIVSEAMEKVTDAEKELADAKADAARELADAEKKLDDAQKEITDGKQEIADGKKALTKAKKQLDTKQKELNAAKKQTDAGFAKLKSGKTQFAAKEAEFTAEEKKAQAGLAQMKAGIQEMQAGLAQIEEQSAKLQTALKNPQLPEEEKVQYETALAGLGAQREELTGKISGMKSESAKISTQLSEGKKALEQAGAELRANEQKLNRARTQITSGQRQISAGRSEIQSKEKELKKAEQKIADGEKELADGQREYNTAKKEAEEKIADGEAEIADARKEIADIGTPEWYVYDRETFPEYSGLGENADRMRALGEVFPVLFFLVAALISLTTMTRMVEEQRTQIGTLKALGYGKRSIAGKYLNYALLATLGGSVAGVLIGQKIYPYIIVTSYKIMYKHIPDLVLPYDMKYAVMATAAAVMCTMLATVAACYKEMAAQPAVLMRPPAPKQGKRVFLERVPFIWRRLSFTWKSTIRNLVRYKKRFFMTVFGIGGCMALMLVGFGIKDSISSIGAIQYNNIQKYHMMAVLNPDAKEEDKKLLENYVDGEDRLDDSLDIYMKNVTLGKGRTEKDTYIYVPDDTEKLRQFVELKNRRTKEKYELTDDGAVLTEKMAKTLGVEPGDSVYLKNGENEKVEVKVTAVCENYLGHYLYMTKQTYEDIYGEKMIPNTKLFRMEERSKKDVRRIGEKMVSMKAVVNVMYMENMKERIEDMLGALDSVIVVLIAAAGMLAFVVLYNLNNINITERRRELATIKVLGFYDLEVAEYVYRENVVLTVIGAVAGWGLGYLLHRFVIVTVEVNDVMFGRNIDARSYLLGFLFTIGFSAFVNWIMYFKLKKINMVESLKSVE